MWLAGEPLKKEVQIAAVEESLEDVIEGPADRCWYLRNASECGRDVEVGRKIVPRGNR